MTAKQRMLQKTMVLSIPSMAKKVLEVCGHKTNSAINMVSLSE